MPCVEAQGGGNFKAEESPVDRISLFCGAAGAVAKAADMPIARFSPQPNPGAQRP
jgi:hypothetical protein